MEKYIYIIQSVSTLNGSPERKDNLFAENSEEEAIKTIERFNARKNEDVLIEGFKVWYIYERIKLFD